MFYVVLISSPVPEFEAEAFQSGNSQTLVYVAGLHSGSVKSAVLYRTVGRSPPPTELHSAALQIPFHLWNCWSSAGKVRNQQFGQTSLGRQEIKNSGIQKPFFFREYVSKIVNSLK